MDLLHELRESGFNLSLNNDNNIVVRPVSSLTQQQREFIAKHKVAIVCELQLEKLYLHWHIVTETYDAYFYVIPASSLPQLQSKFPKAVLIEPAELKK
ncbi:MAG TPA: hypothetical protein EYG29_07615 [Methylococcales bacterium]|nr:hypothetical protein [Methylococcales bacterium]